MELNRIISVEDIRMAQSVDTLDDIEITSFGEIEKDQDHVGKKFLNNGAEDEIDEFVDVYINELPEEKSEICINASVYNYGRIYSHDVFL